MNFKKKRTWLILFCLIILLLSSCASDSDKSAKITEAITPSEESESAAPPTREAVFVYGAGKGLSKRLILNFSGGPVLLPSGYVRLVGVVSGGKPIACLEIGGRGLAVGKGEKVDDYRVARIAVNNVILEK